MIIGEYPCCGGTLALSMPGRSGFAPHDCPHCGAKVWTRFSRVDPETWTDADFRREFVVDDEKRTVKPVAWVAPLNCAAGQHCQDMQECMGWCKPLVVVPIP